MDCHSCKNEVPVGMKFCGECGKPQAKPCANCGFSNPGNFKFCGECGYALTQVKPDQVPGPAGQSAADTIRTPKKKEAERRHLTVMFCDIVGSTAISERLDAEEYRQVILNYQQVAEGIVKQYNGYIAQYLGDGLMVYFGYPQALEEAALLAVQCGIHLLEAMESANVNWEATGQPVIDIRIGVHAGLVVVDDHLALGDTCNIAARLQDLARPNTMVISHSANKLVRGWIKTESQGKLMLKGISRPMEVYAVKGESGARSRMDFNVEDHLTPLVGREQEVDKLLGAWQDAQQNRGSIVLLSGEAGLGKSRLLQVLKDKAKETEKLWQMEFHCSARHQNSALYPVIDFLENVSLKFSRKDSVSEKIRKVEDLLKRLRYEEEGAVPLLAGLLSIPLSGTAYTLLGMSAEEQKDKALHLLLALIKRRAATNRILLLFEDIHWADPSTRSFLDMLTAIPSEAGILMVFTYRPQYKPDWPLQDTFLPIHLKNLSKVETIQIIHEVTKGKMLPAEVEDQIVDRTDGTPLFVEELTKMVLESGLLREEQDHYILTGPLPPLAIPTTLQDSLISRIERFPGAKEVIQTASILGKEFSYELLSAIDFTDNRSLLSHLQTLVNSGFFYQKGLPPTASYQFRHALMQNAAYQSLLRSRRQQLHQQFGMVLEEKFPHLVAAQPEIAAHHFTEAGLKEKALAYWQQAAEKALKASAYIEAAHHVQKGLKLTSTMPDSDKKVQFELAFQVRNSTIIKVQDGWCSERVKEVYDKCFELCQQLDDSEELFTTMFGIWAYYLIGGNIPRSYELALNCDSLVARFDDPNLLMSTKLILGNSLFWLAKHQAAKEHFEAFYEYEKRADKSKMVGFGQDSRIVTYMLDCWNSWIIGELDTAERINRQSLALAQEIDHAFSAAIAHCTAAWYYQFNHDIPNTLLHARRCIDLGFPSYQSWGYMLEGWAMAADGEPFDGLRNIKYGFQILKDQGTGLKTYPSTLLAETAMMARKYEQALEYVEMGLSGVEQNQEGVFAGELLRLQAVANHLMTDQRTVDGAAFERAIARSEQTGSTIFSWRAARSWYQLSKKTGATSEYEQALLAQKRAAIPASADALEQYISREEAFVLP